MSATPCGLPCGLRCGGLIPDVCTGCVGAEGGGDARTPQGPGDQQRAADIKVHKDGTTWLVVDVGVVCPGTRRLLLARWARTFVQAGGRDRSGGSRIIIRRNQIIKAAKKHSEQSSNNFVPFVVFIV